MFYFNYLGVSFKLVNYYQPKKLLFGRQLDAL